MAENLIIPVSEDKTERYRSLIPQVRNLIDGEDNLIANLANIAAALKFGMGFYWVGFYLVKEAELVLGPFQGPIACTRIAIGRGVCGTSFLKKEVILVPDVDEFPGHIACNSASKSEIVLPALKSGEVFLVMDVDSDKLNDFDEIDQTYLQQVISFIEEKI